MMNFSVLGYDPEIPGYVKYNQLYNDETQTGEDSFCVPFGVEKGNFAILGVQPN